MIDRALNHVSERVAYIFTSTSAVFALITPRLPQNYDECAAAAAILSAVIGAGCAIYSTFFQRKDKS